MKIFLSIVWIVFGVILLVVSYPAIKVGLEFGGRMGILFVVSRLSWIIPALICFRLSLLELRG
jgi:hypothetical protein